MKPIPESEIARKVEKLLRDTSDPFLVNHSLRSYLWGLGMRMWQIWTRLQGM